MKISKPINCDICKSQFSRNSEGAILNVGGFDLKGDTYFCPTCAKKLTWLLTREIAAMKMEAAMKNGS